MLGEYGFLIELIKAVGFPAVIFIIWYLYHKSQVEFFKRILEESSTREERNYSALKDLVETLQSQLSTISRIEYKIDTGYSCPIIRKEVNK